ncbi:MAG: hypothetical protein Q9166_007315 [cf. Caloplaca sp. 2 TL-2023]
MTATDTPYTYIPEKKDFLNLPAEVRLEIYSNLLHGCTNAPCGCPQQHQHSPPTLHILNGAESESIHCHKKQPLYPQILRTCRKVWNEATPLLYQENAFVFQADRFSIALDVKPNCGDLMLNRDHDLGLCIPYPVVRSTLAAFILRIGPLNCSLIRNIRLKCEAILNEAFNVDLATELCTFLMPSLQKFEISIDKDLSGGRDPPRNERSHYAHCHEALRKFVHEVHWLKEFKYNMSHQLWNFRDAELTSKLCELEILVKKRAEGEKREKEAKGSDLISSQDELP